MRQQRVVDVKRISSLALVAGTALWLAGCQSTGSVGQLVSSGFESAAAERSHAGRTATAVPTLHMAAGEQVMPPFGFVAFCLRNKADCEGGTDEPVEFEMTPARWAELNDVNSYVNRTVAQVDDLDNRGVAEYWNFPNERGGDCEDLALLKRKMLIERGWPAEALLMTVARERSGDGHAVLTVATDKGDYILDNKNWAIVAWNDAPYIWVKRQSPKRPYVWVSLDRPNVRLAAEQSLPPLGAAIPFLAAVEKARSVQTATALRPAIDTDKTTENAREGRPQTSTSAL